MGVPHFFSYPKSYFFGDLKPHAKYQNPRTTPSGRKVTQADRKKEKERREKNAIHSGHLVQYKTCKPFGLKFTHLQTQHLAPTKPINPTLGTNHTYQPNNWHQPHLPTHQLAPTTPNRSFYNLVHRRRYYN